MVPLSWNHQVAEPLLTPLVVTRTWVTVAPSGVGSVNEALVANGSLPHPAQEYPYAPQIEQPLSAWFHSSTVTETVSAWHGRGKATATRKAARAAQ